MTFDVWLVATAAIAASTSIAPLVDSSSDMVAGVTKTTTILWALVLMKRKVVCAKKKPP